MDQVGVKAPGRPQTTTFLPLQKSVKETILGGPKPSCRLTAGMRSPTLTMALSVARNINELVATGRIPPGLSISIDVI